MLLRSVEERDAKKKELIARLKRSRRTFEAISKIILLMICEIICSTTLAISFEAIDVIMSF